MFEANFAASCNPGIGDATAATNCNVVNTVDVISSATSLLSDALDDALTFTSSSLDGWPVNRVPMIVVAGGAKCRSTTRTLCPYIRKCDI